MRSIPVIGLRLFAFLISVVLSSPSFSQADRGALSGKEKTRVGSAGSQTENIVGQGEAQDQQFLALVHARDRQLAAITEFKAIHVYHNGLRTRIEQTVSGYQDTFPRVANKILEAIDTEMSRADKLERDVRSATDLDAKNQLAKKFDEAYPLFRASTPEEEFLPDPRLQSRTVFIPNFIPNLSPALVKIVSLTRAERQTVAVSFQNVSSENREIINKYDDVFNKLDLFVREASRGPRLRSLDELPRDFKILCGADDVAPNSYPVALRVWRSSFCTV
jgi:hypothetical protein